jgi:hypothetical protein
MPPEALEGGGQLSLGKWVPTPDNNPNRDQPRQGFQGDMDELRIWNRFGQDKGFLLLHLLYISTLWKCIVIIILDAMSTLHLNTSKCSALYQHERSHVTHDTH